MALWVEIARIDGATTEPDGYKVDARARQYFFLSLVPARELVRLLGQEAHVATDYRQFTALINAGFTPEQKERTIELLWQATNAGLHMSVI